MSDPAALRLLGEDAWRWVLGQVRHDEAGRAWIPETAPVDGSDPALPPPAHRDGMHSGLPGLAHVLAEVALHRPWTEAESELAAAVTTDVLAAVEHETDVSWFDGLAGHLGVLTALGEPVARSGAAAVVQRLSALARPDGWPTTVLGPPAWSADARVNDLTLGTAGVLAAALRARRWDVVGATALAEHAADVLLAEAEPREPGLSWPMAPTRYRRGAPVPEMPNLSHGVAGVGTALAVAGHELGRPDLLAAATAGAEHLVAISDTTDGGLRTPHYLPHGTSDEEPVTWSWCHGPTGTASLFAALDDAGVPAVAGAAPADWHERCLHAVATSGVPRRLRPGSWDNDGRCCGTAGVGDVLLDAFQRTGRRHHLDLALQMSEALAERAVVDRDGARWRFTEHRQDPPLLPPGVGWMQGAAGIAAHLLRAARVLEQGRGAAAAPRPERWDAAPPPALART